MHLICNLPEQPRTLLTRSRAGLDGFDKLIDFRGQKGNGRCENGVELVQVGKDVREVGGGSRASAHSLVSGRMTTGVVAAIRGLQVLI